MEGEGGLHRHGKHARTTYGVKISPKQGPLDPCTTPSEVAFDFEESNNRENLNSNNSCMGPIKLPKRSTCVAFSADVDPQAYAGSSSHANPRNNTTNRNTSSGVQRRQQVAREQDQYMPIANVIRIMRRILPPHAKISDDAKETIQECVSEYISFVTSEANERCHQEQRKTITADDVLWAMGKLGFDNYTQPLSLFLQRYREAERESNSVRGESLPKRGLDYGVGSAAVSLPPILPAFNIQGMMYDPAQVVMGGYFRDETGGSSSQQNVNDIHGFVNFTEEVPDKN